MPALTESHGLVQEMASRGLSVVYSLGDADARAQLLTSLTGTLQGAQETLAPASPAIRHPHAVLRPRMRVLQECCMTKSPSETGAGGLLHR